jgi:single-strand DNA-binding protein
MTVAVMVSGALGKQPTQRTSKNGNVYLTASLRVTAANETEWWNLLCFSESAQAEIMRLEVGERLSCQGGLKIELYRGNDGEARVSRTISADAVLALRPRPRERKAKTSAVPASVQSNSNDRRDFSDDIPF